MHHLSCLRLRCHVVSTTWELDTQTRLIRLSRVSPPPSQHRVTLERLLVVYLVVPEKRRAAWGSTPDCTYLTNKTDSAPSSKVYMMDNLSHWWHGELHDLLTTRSAKVQAKYDRLAPSSRAHLMDNLSPWLHGEHFRSPHHSVGQGASKARQTRHHLQGHT